MTGDSTSSADGRLVGRLIRVAWYGVGGWVALEYFSRFLWPVFSGGVGGGLPGVVGAQRILGLAVILVAFVVVDRVWTLLGRLGGGQIGSPPPALPREYPAPPTVHVGALVLSIAVLMLVGIIVLMKAGTESELRQAVLMTLSAGLGASIATILGYLKHASEDKDFDLAFTPWYVARPLIGMLLGLLFFFVVKGGILMVLPELSGVKKPLNSYGLAAIGGLVGLFSKNAVEKLREIFNVLFETKQQSHQELLGRLPSELREQVRPHMTLSPAKGVGGPDRESVIDNMDV